MTIHVLKIGGNELSDPGFLDTMAQNTAALNEPVVIIHGGGKAIAELQSRLGLRPVKVDGLRVTDAESLWVSQMVLSGQVNKAIVAALLAAGVRAVGLSGVDGGLLRCIKKHHPAVDLGLVGEIVAVESSLIQQLLAQGITPVISPISLGMDGQIYNVNADEAAGALAAALAATLLTFVSNVPAVLDEKQLPIAALTAAETEQLIAAGVIHGGMVPKVQAALAVVAQGVPRARIVDLAGLANGQGTYFRA
ncbi:MAG: acetylglutamate kinase [Candidatus Promineifilaceae bacterium]|nr:acetylglutamate kinase [Candidatus Promineifilaceae bacterium]